MKNMTGSDSRDRHCSAFPRVLLEQMLQEARSAGEVEICGLVAARHGHPVRALLIRNIAAEPQRRFSMDPREQIEAFRQMRERGEELYGIYHSHPCGPVEPSATDISEAGYPDVLHLIVSLQNEVAPEIRAYRFRDGSAVPVQLEIQPPPA